MESVRMTTLRSAQPRRLFGPFASSKKDPNMLCPTVALRIDVTGKSTSTVCRWSCPRRERRFLDFLASHIGEPVSYPRASQLCLETQDSSGRKDMIKMTAYRLRALLGIAGRADQSVRSVGYTMPGSSVTDQLPLVTKSAPYKCSVHVE